MIFFRLLYLLIGVALVEAAGMLPFTIGQAVFVCVVAVMACLEWEPVK